MTDFRERYKRLGYGREDAFVNRALRSQRRAEDRREMRSEHFSWRRGLDQNESQDDTLDREEADAAKQVEEQQQEEAKRKADEELEAAGQKRLLQLEKWKEERDRKKLQEKKKAKPVFKVGVVHHRVYSPPLTKNPVPLPPAKLCKSKLVLANPEPPPKKVTRATEKRLAAKAIANHQKRENLRSKKKEKIELPTASQQAPFAPKDHQFRAPIGITPLPMFGRQALASKQNIQLEASSTNISPTTVFSNNAPSSSSFSSSKDHSIIIAKSSIRRSRINRSNTYPCDSSSNKIIKEPTNNSSVDTVVLEMTSDDQEMLGVQENVESDVKMDTSFTKYVKSSARRRSSRIFTPPISNLVSDEETKAVTTKEQEIVETISSRRNASFSMDSPLSNQSKKRTSSKISTPDKIHSNDVDITADQEVREEVNINNNQENVVFNSKMKSPERKSISMNKIYEQNEDNSERSRKNDTFSMDTSIRKQNTAKSKASQRKSIKIASPENQERIEDQRELMDTSLQQQNLIKSLQNTRQSRRLNSINANVTLEGQDTEKDTVSSKQKNSSFSSQTESQTIQRKSRRTLIDETETLEKEASFTLQGQEKHDNQLIDSSVSSVKLNMSLTKDTTPDKPPAFFSPYIVSSRGKTSVRKEVQLRRFSQPADIPTKDTVMQSLNISVEEEERTSQYYKYILDKEIERLNEHCEKWNAVKKGGGIPEEACYIIQSAVGQTQLLINKKFQRFRGLVFDCETGKGEMLVTCKDLQGFWEMMYMEIKDCDNRFNKLEEMKMRNWVEDETEEKMKQPKKNAPVAKKPAAAKKKSAAAAKNSSLRAHIMAARKKKMENKEGEDNIEIKEPVTTKQSQRLQKEDESKNSKIETPTRNTRRTSTPQSSNKWQSLLKKVQLSQTRKSTTSPLIVMKLSQMCKTPEVHLDDSIVYINSDRTPAKGILKTSRDEAMTSSKSANKVFFKEQSMQFESKNTTNNDEDICLDNIDELKEPIERRLAFENESFNASHSENQRKQKPSNSASQPVSLSPFNASANKHLPKIVDDSSLMISMSPLTLAEKRIENSVTKKDTKKTRKQISFKVETNESYSRTLRSSRFAAPLTPISKSRNSVKEDEDSSMEVDDSMQENNDDSISVPEQTELKQLYMNADGIICEKIIPAKIATPRTSRLKRRNSEATQKSAENNKLINLDVTNEMPSTLNLRRKTVNVPEIVIIGLDSPMIDISKIRKSSSTPKVRRQSLKRTFANTTLTADDVEFDEATPPKLSRTPRTLNMTKSNKELNETIIKTSPRLRRTQSLNTTKVNCEESTEKVSIPSLRRKSSKKLQENVEPNEQETDQEKSENAKVIRTPSLKRRNSRRHLDKIEGTEQETDPSKRMSEAEIPNNKRKSLRVTRVSMRSED